VYRGNPFQVEVGVAYGGQLPADELMELYRFANRVPLQYQQSACAISKAVLSVDWRSYGLQQSRGALPTGPLVVSVHVASVWVPFTSESKEAVASYPEILKELPEERSGGPTILKSALRTLIERKANDGTVDSTAATVSLTVNVVQVLTSLQEATLSAVPRLLAVAAAAFFLMPWMWRQMGQYTVKLFSDFHPYVK
jgi:DNA topoisomerase VI B subunit